LAFGQSCAEAVGDPRRALGLMTTAFSIGQIVGPSFAGHLRDATGSYALPTIFAAAALLLATALTAGRSRARA
jgi:predicted MFS family arabinose efflux permease